MSSVQSEQVNTGKEHSPYASDIENSPEEFPTVDSVIPKFDGKKWYQLSHLRLLVWVIFIVSLSSCNNGYDGSLFNSLYAEKDFNNVIGNVSGAVLGALSNGYTFGCFISLFISPYVVDTFGRKPSLQLGNAIMITGVIIQSCAATWRHPWPEDYQKRDVLGMLIVCRIIMGIGCGILTVAAPSLISELSYPPHRQATTAYFNTSWYLGAIVSSWVAYGCRNISNHWNWRVPTIIQGFFPVVQSILIPFFVPESPRFYVNKGKIDKAREVLSKYHGGGYKGADLLVDYEMAEIELAIQQEKEAAQTSYMDFFRTKANRKRLWILGCVGTFMQLSGNGLVSYYLAKVLTSIGITSVNEQLVVNGGLMIYNWGVAILQAVFIIPYIKRRWAFNFAAGGMLFCFILWTILSAINQKRNFQDKSLGQGVLSMIFLYYFCYNFGLNGVPYLYITEVLPYTLRAKGINVFTLFQYIWIIYNGFVNPVAMDAIEWKYYIVWCCVLGVEVLLVYFTFPETSGYTLEEVAEVFGDAADLRKASYLAATAEEKPEHSEVE